MIFVTGGGGKPHIVLTVAGRHAAATLGGLSPLFEAFEDTYFSRTGDSTYTCLKAGTYNVQYFYKPGYNNGGALVNVQLVIQVNGANVVNVNSTAAPGGNGTATVTLAEGDELALLMRNTTNSANTHVGGMVLTTT